MKREKIKEIYQALGTSSETPPETPFVSYTRECLDEVRRLHVELEMVAANLIGAAMSGNQETMARGIEGVLERIRKANEGWRPSDVYKTT